MITVDQIRTVLQQVMLSEVSLDRFDEWLTERSWNMHKDSSPEAVKLVGQIESMLDAYDSDRISKDQLIGYFRKIVPVVFISNVGHSIVVVNSGTANTSTNVSPSESLAISDKQRGMVFGYAPLLPA